MLAHAGAVEQIDFALDHSESEMQRAYRTILRQVGEDEQRKGLFDTPKRAAKAMEFLTQGYTMAVEDVVNDAFFSTTSEDLVLVRNIEFYSLCEHHMLPFNGRCHIGYLPQGKVLGLSKLARIVDVFARRLQIQENLTRQIAEAIADVVSPRGVAVQMTASHMCMMMRGVEKQASDTTTTAFLGEFGESRDARVEFLQQLGAMPARV